MKAKFKTMLKNKFIKLFVFSLLAFLFVFLVFEIVYREYYSNKISPNVYLLNTNLGGYNQTQFTELINKYSRQFSLMSVGIDDSVYKINLGDIKYSVDPQANWQIASKAKKPSAANPVLFTFAKYFSKTNINPVVIYDKDLLAGEVDKIINLATSEPVFEKIILENGEIINLPGKDGYVINKTLFDKELNNALAFFVPGISFKTEKVSSAIDANEKNKITQKATNLIGKKLVAAIDEKKYDINDADLIETLNDRPEDSNQKINNLLNDLSNFYNKEAKDSIFVFEDGKVVEFSPSEDGVAVDVDLLKLNLLSAIDLLSESADLELQINVPFKKTPPQIITGDINNLGIKEKIGSGYSTFRGSILSRIHNIKLAASKFNGVLIAPNETMSFNKVLGDVSKVTGYQQAYVIKDGQTVLGDGGGVCQVSTTLFRAALNTGLPIIERRSHSYRVGYYEQGYPPGLDATVFDPSTDLKIKNNTENHILIQTVFNEADKSLTFDLYGTGDGRISTVGKPVITSTSAPPEDLYIDDPSIKTGVTKQIEYKAWGAKVYFNYSVEKDGAVIFEKIFYSNYQPWQAKFLRGTAP